jgi:aminoglycoside 2'-N-acetyltransferase I
VSRHAGALRIAAFPTSAAPAGLLEQVQVMVATAFPGGFPDEDWNHALGGSHVVVWDEGGPLAHAAVVDRVLHVADAPLATGYLETVATAPARQGEGLGTLAVRTAMALLQHRFDLGALSTGAHRFYERLGWERWAGPTSVRTAEGDVRTPDDDDAVMVLRFGPSRDLDLRAPLSCEERPGDVW